MGGVDGEGGEWLYMHRERKKEDEQEDEEEKQRHKASERAGTCNTFFAKSSWRG